MNTAVIDRPEAGNQQAAAPEETILTPVKALILPNTMIITRQADAAVRMADSFTVTNGEDFELAAEELASVKGKINRMEAQRTAITGPMNTALQAINDLFRGPMQRLKSAETTIKTVRLTYSDEQERIAAAARREAEKLAAIERERLAQEARDIEAAAAHEKRRLAEAETQRVATEKVEREALDAKAAEALAKGDAATMAAIEQQVGTLIENSEQASRQTREQVEQIEQAATGQAAAVKSQIAITSAPAVYVAPAKATGISKSVTYDFELQDMAKLIAHIATKPELSSLLCLDTVKTRAYVRSLGANTHLPGLRVFSKSTLSARAA